MHYQVWGDPVSNPNGTPLVLIHGFASSSQEFFRLAPLLSEQRTVIGVDLLGFGFSQRLDRPDPRYSQRGQAALVAGLLDALGVAEADVLGASYGGAVAGELALARPDLVGRIVFVDAQIYGEGAVGEGNRGYLARLPFGLNRALTWLTLGGGPLATQVFDLACHDVEACLADGDLIEAVRPATTVRGNVDALLAFAQTPEIRRLPDDISAISQPALVIWGRHDRIILPENGQRLVADLPDAQLEWIESAGHIPHVEQPQAVAALVLAFLQEN